MTMDEPGFASLSKSRVAIVGLGLMGGSLAFALRGRCAGLVGVDRDARTLHRARSLGFLAEITDDLISAARAADVLILATPVRTILAQLHLLANAGGQFQRPLSVLDIGSTKAEIVQAMERLPSGWEAVGGHPLCGKETAGLEAADGALFQDKTFCLTPVSGRTSRRARALAEELVAAVGAWPSWIEAERHDRLVAVTSHLPYLLSAALASRAGDIVKLDPSVAELIASGFRDTTRLAASDVSMMADILTTNREAVLAALDGCAHALADLRVSLAAHADEALKAQLESARAARLALCPSNSPSPRTPSTLWPGA